jgi:hypothetical protein
MGATTEGMRRVAKVADRIGLAVLADAAGVPESTLRSYRDRGWTAESLLICDRLIAAADRLERAGQAGA